MKITVKANMFGKIIESSYNESCKDHLNAQIKFPRNIQKSKKAYSRNSKHKNKMFE